MIKYLRLFLGSILGFIITFGCYYWERSKVYPDDIVQNIQQDFVQRTNILNREHSYKMAHKKEYLPQSTLLLNKYPAFGFTEFKNGVAQIWSYPEYSPVALDSSFFFNKSGITKVNNVIGYYEVDSFWDNDKNVIVDFWFVPIKIAYKRENTYLQSRFVASKNIPIDIDVVNKYEKNAVKISNNAHHISFYVKTGSAPFSEFKPSLWVLGFFFISVILFSQINYYLIVKKIFNDKSAAFKWMVSAVYNALIFALFYFIPTDLLFSKIDFYSPNFTSFAWYANSLFYIFLLQYVLFCFFNNNLLVNKLNFKLLSSNKIINSILNVVIIVIFIWIAFPLESKILYKTVIDSKICFDVIDVSNLTFSSFAAFLTLIIIVFNSILAIQWVNRVMKCYITPFWLRGVVFSLLMIAAFFLSGLNNNQYLFIYFLFAIFVFALENLTSVARFYREFLFEKSKSWKYIIVWMVTIIVFTTNIYFYLDFIKERIFRQEFVKTQKLTEDSEFEFIFSDIEDLIKKDARIKNSFKSIYKINIEDFKNYIQQKYLAPSIEKYSTNIYVLNSNNELLSHSINYSVSIQNYTDSIYKNEPQLFTPLIFIPFLQNGHNTIYWAKIPIKDNGHNIGFLVFDFSLESMDNNPINNLLTRDYIMPQDQQYIDRYSYGIYYRNNLIFQSSNNLFPEILNAAPVKNRPYVYNEGLLKSNLLYQAPKDHFAAIAIYSRNLALNYATILSYNTILTILFLFTLFLIIKIVNYYEHPIHPLWGLKVTGLRNKLKTTLFITVAITFLLAWLITSIFIYNFNKTSQENEQRTSIHSVINVLENNYNDYVKTNENSSLSDFIHSLSGQYAFKNLAKNINSDILIYDADGILIDGSDDNIMANKLESNYLSQSFLMQFKNGNSQEIITASKIGSLKFNAVFETLKDNKNQIIGYVKMPYYASQLNATSSVSNIIAALFNIYSLLFFTSLIIILTISKGLNAPFNFLIEQFRNMNLNQNKVINWPYNDEIGMLVDEYNLMIRKLDHLTEKMLISERETTWKEIAQQVAHEIKNPLTPMKLNIQYLQKAIEQNRPDVVQLTSRVTEILMEQIDNLTLISGEFSEFAKLPESIPEKLDLIKVVSSIVALFKDNENQIVIGTNSKEVFVWADKSHLIRIFTNLIKNAIQAVPNDTLPNIKVDLQRFGNEKVVVSVTDNGSGIPESIWDKLFRPNFTTKNSGSGLGLAMTKKMVELASGQIWFKTEANIGTTFFVSFKLY